LSSQPHAVSIRRLLALVLLCALAVAFGVAVWRTADWIDRAKLVLSAFMFAGTAAGLFVFFKQREIHQTLVQLELAAERQRDDAMFECTALRQRFSALGERLSRRRRGNRNRFNQELVQHAGSALMLVIERETGWLKWTWWAARLGKSAWDYFARQ